jgi:hypothetical protein
VAPSPHVSSAQQCHISALCRTWGRNRGADALRGKAAAPAGPLQQVRLADFRLIEP